MTVTVPRPVEAPAAPAPPPARPEHSRQEADNVAGISQEEWVDLVAARSGPTSITGPFDKVHAFWLAGMSCDGCSIAVLGATAPKVEDLLTGTLPGLPVVSLHHTALQLESGDAFVEPMRRAVEGTLGAPYVVIYEGSIADERLAAATGGYWSAIGEEHDPQTGESKSVPSAEWLRRLAPGAAAVFAIGTCATWGGIPAAYGNVTGSMSVMDFLGKDYRSALGLNVVNVPGCSPIGDNFTETIATVLQFLQGLGPLPEFDDLGRPAWLFSETVHRNCVRAGYYEEGTFAHQAGDRECLVEIGCWGPVVQCNITSRGAINHLGGCMNVGGACIGCTMPGFPDKFTPFYKAPPGTFVSGSASKLLGSFVRPLRRITQRDRNREPRWDQTGQVPSGWGAPAEVTLLDRGMDFFYNRLRRRGAGGTTGRAG
ncbi:MAG: hydrogenase expression protein HypE [Chloroflexi bacterium]|nr:hydrogenase expression protein HypE [Chloroflexota bacterium]